MSPMWRSRTTPLLIGNQTLRFSTSTRAPSDAPFPLCSANCGRPRPLPFFHGHRVKAGNHVAGLELAERRHLEARLFDLEATAGLEGTGLRRAEHVPRRTFDRLQPRLPLGVEARDALQKAERVWVA